MCGIVGFIDKSKNKDVIIKKMANRIAHRGPDGEGYYIDDFIALGHKRLSIIDIDGGMEPFINERYVLIYNGEIYNYKELRNELKSYGYKFRTNSDTEVILIGYQKWGSLLPKKLRGMFVFAIWDKEENALFCARDHFGIKPFYYYQTENVFLFASEIKAFLEHPNFKKELNENALGLFLTFSFTPTNETFFKNVFSLEPGHTITIKNNKLKIEQYYKVTFSKDKYSSNLKIIKEIRKTLNKSVKLHLVSDVRIGAFLSSGIDSSYITALSKVKNTYTIGYNNENYSEINYAEDLAQKLKIQNKSKILTKEEFLASVEKVIYYMDEPLCDPSAISLYHLSKLACKDVKVVLGGEGADEFFAGYNTYKICDMYKLYDKIPYFIRKSLATIFKFLPEIKGRNFIVREGEDIDECYVGVDKVFDIKEIKKILKDNSNINIKNIITPYLDENKCQSKIEKMQLIDINLWLVKDILLKSDKMAMANSIEVRCPFVDKEVFNLASRLPNELKISNGKTKIGLREASKNIIPNSIYNKEKLGFPVPLREWMREDDLYSEILETFNKDYVKMFFNQKYIIKLLNDHKLQKRDNYKKIWIIYIFLKWYDIFFIKL